MRGKKLISLAIAILSIATLTGCEQTASSKADTSLDSSSANSKTTTNNETDKDDPKQQAAPSEETLKGKTFELSTGGIIKFDANQVGTNPLGDMFSGQILASNKGTYSKPVGFSWTLSDKCPVTQLEGEDTIFPYDVVKSFTSCGDVARELIFLPEKPSGKISLDEVLDSTSFSLLYFQENGSLNMQMQPTTGGPKDTKEGPEYDFIIGNTDVDAMTVNDFIATLEEKK